MGRAFMNAPRSRSVILCIDDQASALTLRKLVLQRKGYQVLTATCAPQALDVFRKNHVDLVLMERVDAHPDSSALAARMKMLKPEIPLAIYSADRAEFQDMRFADIFITKLVPVDELLRTIEGLLKDQTRAA